MTVIFFGSTFDSVLVLEKLFSFGVSCIVTQPPRPVGRKQEVTPTPVETWAKTHNVTVLSFPSDPGKPWLYASEHQVVDALQPLKADLIVSACYGQKIPFQTIQAARFGGLNVHPSLLPRWRGADPVPWTILSGDQVTGVTIVTLSEKFDEGRIIVQKKIPITDTDTSDALRTKLFTLGADLLTEVFAKYLTNKSIHSFTHSLITSLPYARRLTRDDGFEPWEAIQKAFENSEEARRIDRKFRAFFPWPGLWTTVGEKRLKILACHLSPVICHLNLDTVQWEGKKPIAYSTLLTGHRERLHLNQG